MLHKVSHADIFYFLLLWRELKIKKCVQNNIPVCCRIVLSLIKAATSSAISHLKGFNDLAITENIKTKKAK